MEENIKQNKCSKCGKDLKLTDKKCDNCEIEPKKASFNWQALAGILIILLVVVGFVWNILSEQKNIEPDAIKIKAPDLYLLYKANEADADIKYRDKILEVSGSVDITGVDSAGSPYVTLKTNDILGAVQCVLPTSEIETIDKLKAGDPIVVRGRNVGILINVVLLDCVLK